MIALSQKSYFSRLALSLLILPFTLLYQWSFLWNTTVFHQSVVFSVTACMLFLAWYRWTLAVYVFIFSIPLFNTLPGMLQIPWPAFSINYCFLGALLTVFFLRMIWEKPYTHKSPHVFMTYTPFDFYIFVLVSVICVALLTGWMRFNNVFISGFYTDIPRQIVTIPFLTQFDNYLSFTRAWQFISAILAFYIICSTIRHRHQLRTIIWLIAYAGLLVSLYGILQYYFGFGWVGINWFFLRINATLNGPHAAGIFFATHSVLVFSLLLASRAKWRKLLAGIIMLFSLIGLWFTGTRSAAFALIVVVCVLAGAIWVRQLFMSLRLRYISAIVVAGLLFIGPGYSLFFPDQGLWSALLRTQQYRRFTDGLSRLDFDQRRVNEWLAFRFYHWISAAGVVKDYPFAGAGLGTFDKLYREYKAEQDRYKTAYAHAIYLDILTEGGVIALFAFLGIYCVAILLMWKVLRTQSVSWRWKVMGTGLFIAVYLTFVTNFFTSDLYYVPEIQLWTALLFALVVKDYQINFDPAPRSFRHEWHMRVQRFSTALHARRYRIVIMYGMLLCAAAYIVWTWARSAAYGREVFMQARQYTLIDRILEYGIYSYEYDRHNNKFGLTARTAYTPVRVRDSHMRVLLRARHPDIQDTPVRVDVYLDGTHVADVTLSNRAPYMLRVDISEWLKDKPAHIWRTRGIPAVFRMESSHTWNPHRMGVAGPDRNFGVDLGAIEWGFFAREEISGR